jgi:hypothetical protein
MAVTYDLEQFRLRSRLRSLYDELLDLALEDRFFPSLSRAIRRFYGRDANPDAMLDEILDDEDERARFFPWYLWDVRHDRRGPVGAHHLAQAGERLDPYGGRLVKAFLASSCRLWEVIGADGERLELRDASEGRVVTVRDAELAQDAEGGAVVFGRLVEPGPRRFLDAVYAVLPPAMYQRFREHWPRLPQGKVAWARAFPRVLMGLDHVAEEGLDVFTPGGERIVPSRVVAGLADSQAARDTLTRAGVASAAEPYLALRHPGTGVLLGIASVCGPRLEATCCSVERASVLGGLLQGVLGPACASLITVHSNLDFAAMEVLEQMSLPEEYVHDPDLSSALAEVIREFLDDWWDVPNPRLSGRTPREAVSVDARGREAVSGFLARLERTLQIRA